LRFSPSVSPLVSGPQDVPSKPVTEPNRPVIPAFNIDIDESAYKSLLQEQSSSGAGDYLAMTLPVASGRDLPPHPVAPPIQPSANPPVSDPAQNPPIQPLADPLVPDPAQNPPIQPLADPNVNVPALGQPQNAINDSPGSSATNVKKTEEHPVEVTLTLSETNQQS
jgi:hypothetical protein